MARTVDDDDGARTWAPGVSAETVLWAVWDALDVAGRWNRLALRGGKRGARADRDLDAVVGLFDAAQRYVDRLPAAGPDAFLEHIQGQDVPGDTLAARAQSGDGVALVTPAGAAGREWRYVAVAGVQEGVWPDLRLRGSLLGSEELVAVVDRPRPDVPGGADGGALRRDAVVPRRGVASVGAAAGQRGAQ